MKAKKKKKEALAPSAPLYPPTCLVKRWYAAVVTFCAADSGIRPLESAGNDYTIWTGLVTCKVCRARFQGSDVYFAQRRFDFPRVED